MIQLENILNLNQGNLIKIKGMSEVPGQEYDDILTVTELPQMHDNCIIINFKYPSGTEDRVEMYLDFLEDIDVIPIL